jgi:hypothetical protein
VKREGKELEYRVLICGGCRQEYQAVVIVGTETIVTVSTMAAAVS